MRITLFLILLVMCTVATAQTPFEFAVVEELIQGSPFISVLRIKIVPGSPMPGRTQLEISTRAGMAFYGESSIFPDSLENGQVSFVGLAEYSATLPTANVERIFSVLHDCLRRFPSTGITDIALDVVSIDDMSWMAVGCPVSSIDSLLDGSVSHLEFWRNVSLRELEVGTSAFQTMLQWPGVPADYTPEEVAHVVIPEPRSTEPWKSLILPGWGQLDAGVGAGWMNLLVEAGGIVLLVSGEDEAGMAVLGANHLVSFVDLF